ncbi:MAG: universal stress protein [Caldilineaceae bacterium]|nr:universal stress protein [Caldilineaceae bacterium]
MTKRRVLVLIDGSAYSLLILHYVKLFLAPETHTITLLCVQEEPLPAQHGHLSPVDATEKLQQLRATLTTDRLTELTPHQQTLEEAGYTTAIAVRFGDPISEIDRFLDENRVDLIAMTTHGHAGLRRVLLGSVAQHLIQQGALPILLYRPFGYE